MNVKDSRANHSWLSTYQKLVQNVQFKIIGADYAGIEAIVYLLLITCSPSRAIHLEI